MNEHAILHIPESRYCFPLDNNKLIIRLRLSKQDEIDKVELIYESKYRFQQLQQEISMERKYEDALFAYYEIMLEVMDTRLAYIFRIWEKGKERYFSEDGITEDYNFELGYFNFFQLPYINDADIHREVPWMEEAIFYQIFVDRFYKGKENKNESYINLEWGEKPASKSFAGGDIPGITKKLDYIKEMGVNTLYLTPVFQSISNHKYDISDYQRIDEQFGTNEDFAMLVKQAHKNGMRIVMDAVFNHSSDRLPQFQDVVKRGKESPYFDWFIIEGEKPDKETLNYEVFAFCNYMPKFDTSNPQVQEFLLDIAVWWIEKYDIDGWRLDVSDEVSHDFWRKFRKRVKAVKSDCVIIGENWHDANSFLQGDQYDSIMNYAFTKACLDYYAFDDFSAKELAEKLNHLLMRNTWQVNRMMLNLLDSHDTERFYTRVDKNKDKVLSAIALMCMFVGVPCIYYGTEILTEGGYDPDSRRCFDWNQDNWDKDFKEILSGILGLRTEEAVKKGEIRISAARGLLCLKRFWGQEEITIYTNQSNKAVAFEAEGNVLIENNYNNGLLHQDGFIVVKR